MITLILSNVFLIYDYVDYSSGKYNPVRANRKLPTEEAVKDTFDMMRNSGNSESTKEKYEEEILINVSSDDCNVSYKADDGIFNNDALEMAAKHLIASTNPAKEDHSN